MLLTELILEFKRWIRHNFGKECFDMLKSIGFEDLVRLFSSSRRSDRVYLGWFVWDLVGRLFRMQALRLVYFCGLSASFQHVDLVISGFFGFFWLIVWADGINKCGWLKGLHQIPSLSWIFHHSSHFHIY